MGPFAPWEKELIRLTSGGLPLVECPYRELSKAVGVSEQIVMERLREWVDQGIIRRMGALVNHRAVGIRANGMSVWNVPDREVDAVAKVLCERSEVTHCYRRPRRPGWPYNLFAMVHGTSEDQVRELVAELAQEAGAPDYAVLFSNREYKKTAPRYFDKGEDK